MLYTHPTIQCLKRNNTDTLVITISIGKLNQRKMIIQITLETNYISSQHLFKSFDCTLRLPIGLGIKSHVNLNMSIKEILERFPKLRSDLGTSIGDNGKGHLCNLTISLKDNFVIVFHHIRNFDMNKMS